MKITINIPDEQVERFVMSAKPYFPGLNDEEVLSLLYGVLMEAIG